jgi:hypothetical protein
LRIRSHTKGEAFSLKIEFDRAFITVPGRTYYGSMYTLINCPLVGCESAEDSISVKVKDGDNGMYREIYKVIRSHDVQWVKEFFSFTATENKTYVRKYFNNFKN